MVDYHTRNNVAILQIANPPVNALSYSIRVQCIEALHKAANDPLVRAVVLCGGNGMFLSGADIKEFSGGDLLFYKEPNLLSLCNDIEASEKPVVAAIEKFALGGGLEVAISAHYRIAERGSKLGFPEVKLGVLPAASGTQRMPRLVGVRTSYELITSGRHFGTQEALTLGVIDKVFKKISQDSLLNEAVKFAQSIIDTDVDTKRTSKLPVKDADLAEKYYLDAVERLGVKKKLEAPLMCLQAVLAAAQEPFQEGLRTEQRLAMTLFSSRQAAALQYAFFVTRAAPKWKLPCGADYKSVTPQRIRFVAVIGAGTMGAGIIVALLSAGMKVVLLEQQDEFLKSGMSRIQKLYDTGIRLKKFTREQANTIMRNNLTPTLSYDDIRNVDMVIECVFEDMTLKKEVFRRLDQTCNEHTILCTNTSSLDIDQIAAVTSRPHLVMGTHFFSPANIMTLLENVKGDRTSVQTIATVMNFGRDINKVPVLVGNCYAFVANRMNFHYWDQSCVLLEEGALPEQIDQIMEDFGMAIGPFRTMDLAGNDVLAKVAKEYARSRGCSIDADTRHIAGERTSVLSLILAQSGRLGQKSGSGWYKYSHPGAKIPSLDPWVENMLQKYRERHHIAKRNNISSQEVRERLLYGMINEGFKILEEGIATKPEDIDTIFLLGFGWPRHLGGPMFYANELGLDTVCNRLHHYYRDQPSTVCWQSSKFLERLAEDKVPMRKWMRNLHTTSTSKL